MLRILGLHRGVGGQRSDPAAVTAIAQPFGLIAAAVAVMTLAALSVRGSTLVGGLAVLGVVVSISSVRDARGTAFR